MRIDVAFIGGALVFLIFGMAFGMWMGARENFQLADAHAHLNLVGFVVPALYGLVHHAYPGLAHSRLAWPQCIVHFVGVILFVPGIVVSTLMNNQLLVIAGSVLIMLATLMFGLVFWSAEKSN